MASKTTKRVITYLVERLQEPSTIRGIVLIAAIFGAKFSTEVQMGILEAGLLISGLIAVALPDKWKTKDITPAKPSDAETEEPK